MSEDEVTMARKLLSLGADETRAVLETAPWRLLPGHRVPKIQIFYQNRWRDLYRTDLMDDVATTRSSLRTPSDYRDAVRLGARVTDDGFGVVDAYSDG